MGSEFKRIVIFRTDRIGEVLLSTVSVNALKTEFPDASITFVTSEYSKPLIENRDDVENIITVDTLKKKGVFRKSLALTRELKRGNFDIAFVFNPHKILHLACFLAGIPKRFGYSRKWGFLLTNAIDDERYKGCKHEVFYALDLLKIAGVEIGEPVLELPVPEADSIAVEERLEREIYEKNKHIAVVHPGSSNPAKLWPVERYAELVKKLKDEEGCTVALIGSSDERKLNDILISRLDSSNDVVDLTGQLSLTDLAALFKKAEIFIGNDTGPMHMAAAVKTPVIAIFGRNIPGVGPIRWGPWGKKNAVFYKPPNCLPCRDADCENDYKCLKNITVEAVFGAVKDLLTEN